MDVKLVAAIEQKALKHTVQKCCGLQKTAMHRTHTIAPSRYLSSGARKYVNLSERAGLLSQLTSLPREERLFVVVLIWSGARVTEILSLMPQSFQLEACVVAVRTLKRRRHVVREIPISSELIAELDSCFDLHQREREPKQSADRL